MLCLHPITIRNPNWGTAKQTNDDMLYIKVPCGKCIACQNNRRSSWVLRNRYENLYSESSIFVTLTYNDENIPLTRNQELTLDYEDVKKFIKRLRKKFPDTYLKYFLCGEYGSHTFRPHYHAIIYNLPLLNNGKDFVEYYNKILADTWGLGHVTSSVVTDARIGYITKYIIKSEDERKKYQESEIKRPKLLVSRGIGKGLETRVSPQSGTLRFFGRSYVVPRYVGEKFAEIDSRRAAEFKQNRAEFARQRAKTILDRLLRRKGERAFQNTKSDFLSEKLAAERLLKRCKTQKDL